MRQLHFITNYDRSKSNKFLDSVYNFYEINGFITEKQADVVSKKIW